MWLVVIILDSPTLETLRRQKDLSLPATSFSPREKLSFLVAQVQRACAKPGQSPWASHPHVLDERWLLYKVRVLDQIFPRDLSMTMYLTIHWSAVWSLAGHLVCQCLSFLICHLTLTSVLSHLPSPCSNSPSRMPPIPSAPVIFREPQTRKSVRRNPCGNLKQNLFGISKYFRFWYRSWVGFLFS